MRILETGFTSPDSTQAMAGDAGVTPKKTSPKTSPQKNKPPKPSPQTKHRKPSPEENRPSP